MLDTTALKNELQARINALTNASTFEQVVDVAITARKATSAGVLFSRTILDSQLQRVTNAVGAENAIDDLILLAASAQGDADSVSIGSTQKFAFSGEKFVDNNNFEWLLLGLLHTKDGYDRALNNPGLQSYGRQVYTASSTTAGQAFRAAEDGLGNIVIACGNLTNVIVSNDWGQNFRAVPHNLPNRGVTVEYVGGHFVIASNNSDGIRTSYSANGGNSFSAASVARGLSGAQTDTVRSSSSGAGALFAVQNDSAGVFKTSGTTNAAVTFPAVLGSYVPIVQHFNGAFYVAAKNAANYYKTINNGASFTTHSKSGAGMSMVGDEYMTVALGKVFWMGQSGSSRLYRYSDDFITWHDLFEIFPAALKAYFTANQTSSRISIHPVVGGVVVCSLIGNYFSADLISWKLINFSRSSEEIGGSGSQYNFFRDLFFGGPDIFNPTGSNISASIFKVDYSTPDYVGVHKHGVPAIDADGLFNYVRIK